MMNTNKGNCLIGQSGGPTVAINASLCGVIEEALQDPNIQTIYGMVNGIEGFLEKNILNLSDLFQEKEKRQFLKTTPAMYLGSCRYKLPSFEENPKVYEEIFKDFQEMNIRYFFYIGGNDSMDTVWKLSQYAKKVSYPIQIIGIPKTIDNDLPYTDHTPGFGSAAKYVATSLLEIAHDSYIYDLPSVTIVEIMGRNAGWLTAASVLARTSYHNGPDFIYLPEVPFVTYEFLKDLRELQKVKKNIIVAVSEGIKNPEGNYIASQSVATHIDGFGHAQLSGVGKALEYMVQTALSCKVRSIELSVLQRSAMHNASRTDLDEAQRIGQEAVKAAQKGITGHMMVLVRESNNPYTLSVSTVPVEQVANQEKKVPREWINSAGNDVTQEMVDYLQPLIIGEVPVTYQDGLPKYCNISHLTQASFDPFL